MPELRCKPGQLAQVQHASRVEPCSQRCVGTVVRVVVLSPIRSARDAIEDMLEGPQWDLESPIHCPSGQAGCDGITRMPDRCLRPFDPESAPEPVAEGAPVSTDA